VEVSGSTSGIIEVWLNGKSVYRRDQGTPRPDADRFTATLPKGSCRLLVQIASATASADFQLRFRRKSSKAEHEALIRAVLNRTGNADRGRALFLNADKSLCIKCHRLGEQGERVGPELTGVGGRLARVYVAESIAETDAALTLVDSQGQKHTVAKGDIDERRTLPTSTMPEGLEKRFTPAEFLDLVTFLMSQRAK
jgi:cytochrome c2